jgi:hypothetical protein
MAMSVADAPTDTLERREFTHGRSPQAPDRGSALFLTGRRTQGAVSAGS